jgi:malonyl-CoA O-methyltransferase
MLARIEVRRAFERAAPTYEMVAHVQNAAAQRLLAFAATQGPPAKPRRVLDAGCGPGQSLPALAARFPQARCLALDFSPAMLARAARALPTALPVCADIERLPFPDGSLDLYWSSLALQWCDPATALLEAARVLAPGGAAWIATLGPRTLHELRAAFSAVDENAHVIDFSAADHWIEAARSAGFALHAHTQETLFDLAADLRALLGNIKRVGAHVVGEKRRRRTLGRRGWQALQSAYENFRRPDGALPATYDLILLALRKPG